LQRSLVVLGFIGLVATGVLAFAGCDGSGGKHDSDAGIGGAGGGGRGGNTGGAVGAGGQVGACAFSSTYTVMEGAGLIGISHITHLTPPQTFDSNRQDFRTDAAAPSCSPALPACHDAALIDVSDVEAAVAHADVQAAFAQATPPQYGDRGIADGPYFSFTRADGRGLGEGIACTTASATCTPTPGGVRTLLQLLKALLTQQRADASCADVR
jgi:hypothetical protein